MSFWENVDAELEYKGMTRKALATEAGFNLGNVGKGIKLGSSPSADTAVRIAKVLGVTVEYLVNGTDSAASKKDNNRLQKEMELFRKYRKTVEKLDALPQGTKAPIVEMIDKIEVK